MRPFRQKMKVIRRGGQFGHHRRSEDDRGNEPPARSPVTVIPPFVFDLGLVLMVLVVYQTFGWGWGSVAFVCAAVAAVSHHMLHKIGRD